MQHLIVRTGSRIKRWAGLALAVVLLGAAVVAAVRYFMPERFGGRPTLQLVALDASGRFDGSITLPRGWADTSYTGAYGAKARVPLVLAVRNVGTRAARANWLEISLPDRYRLLTGDGRELPHQSVPGNPLIRYVVAGPLPEAAPGRLPSVLASPDTIWLEPMVPSLYCLAVGDSVPEFVPATPPDPRILSRITAFYSFQGEGLPGRQAGLLGIRIDPSLVQPGATPTLRAGPVRTRAPGQPLPLPGPLGYVGANRARCGAPEQPMEITSYLWETPAGGRVFALYYGDRPRKYLLDLDRDGFIDAEIWDADGDGEFDTERDTHYATPAFLLPPPGPPPFNPAVWDSIPADSIVRLQAFRAGGLYRPGTAPADSTGIVVDTAEAEPFHGAGIYVPRSGGRAAGTMAPLPAGAAAAPATPVRPPSLPVPSGVRLLGKPVDTLRHPPPR